MLEQSAHRLVRMKQHSMQRSHRRSRLSDDVLGMSMKNVAAISTIAIDMPKAAATTARSVRSVGGT